LHWKFGSQYKWSGVALWRYTANLDHVFLYLGAFAKLWKATISFVVSVCLTVCLPFLSCVRMEQLGCPWSDVSEFLYIRGFLNICRTNSSAVRMDQWNKQ
jgi:hypothetical protein